MKKLLLLTALWVLGQVNSGQAQTLYDVVASLADRDRVLQQRLQVEADLQGNSLPSYNLIDWHGSGTEITAAVNNLGISDKIALLNQAAMEFDNLKFEYLNTNPEELATGATIGSIRPYLADDFAPLPRATTANFNEILRLLAQRVRALRVLPWPAKFQNTHFNSNTWLSEEVDTDNGPPHVVLKPDGATAPANWSLPSKIDPANADSSTTSVDYIAMLLDSSVIVSGSYGEYETDDPFTLHDLSLNFDAHYPASAQVKATATGASVPAVQIGGTIQILRRAKWNEIDTEAVSDELDPDKAGYVVAGGGSSGTITISAAHPSATVKGYWKADPDNEGRQFFVPGGYTHLQVDDNYGISHEKNWAMGCKYYSVFKPTFTRGVDAAGFGEKINLAAGILADGSADGELLLHPRAGLMFGIDLGPGIHGTGDGLITAGVPIHGNHTHSQGEWWDYNLPWYGVGGGRFDSTYLLRFAGSGADYHVVYDNVRSGRSQVLPDLGWPISDEYGDYHDTFTLFGQWDSPRLKQVVGRDLVADIVYDGNHYGGYTVNIYRRPTEGITLTAGQALDVSDMPLVRTWTFAHPVDPAHPPDDPAYPTDAEKLVADGKDGEVYEIRANQTLPRFPGWWGGNWQWWWGEDGEFSWTLKLSKKVGSEKIEKFAKEIGISNLFVEYVGILHDTFQRVRLDGQQLQEISSQSLNPFSMDVFPEDWVITAAGKTITGEASVDRLDPNTQYGRFPSQVTVDYDGVQPDADYSWGADGLLESAVAGAWSSVGSASGNTYTLTRKFNGGTYATDWTDSLDGGNRVRQYSAPDGNAGNKTDTSVAWSEVEYGTATNGLPGLPRIVRNSDGSGATYAWAANADGSYILTLDEGLLPETSVTRGSRLVRDVNAHGHPNEVASFVMNGATLKVGGAVFSNFTAWGMPKKSTDYTTGLFSTWDYSGNLSRLSTHTGELGLTSDFSGYDVLGRTGTVICNGITAGHTYSAGVIDNNTTFNITTNISGAATGSITDSSDALGRLTSSNTTWNGLTDNLSLSHGAVNLGVTRTHGLLGTHQSSIRQNDGSLASSTGPTLAFGGTTGDALIEAGGLLKSKHQLGNLAAASQTTWTDAWGRIREIDTPPASGSGASVATGTSYSPPGQGLKRVIVTEPSGRILITETDPYNASGMIRRSGIDRNGNGSLGATDRYVESVTTIEDGKVVTTLSRTERAVTSGDNGLREILRTVWNPVGGVTVTTINGGEESITRTPHFDTTPKTVVVTSSKGWSKTETLNNLGLTANSKLSGTGIPLTHLDPVWRADGSLASVSLKTGGTIDGEGAYIGGATHSATFNTNGTLATLIVPGKGNILAPNSHTISGGIESITLEGTTHAAKLDGTENSTSGGNTIGKTRTLAINGGGFQETIHPAVGSNTVTGYNAAGAPTGKLYADASGEIYNHTREGLLESVTLARGGDLEFVYSEDGAKDLTTAVWPEMTSGVFTCASVAHGYSHDRAGRVDGIGDASGGRGLVYQNGRLQQTTWDSGALAGYSVVKSLDEYGRDAGFTLYRGSTVIHSATRVPNGVSGEISEITSAGLKVVLGRNAARQITGFQWGNATGTFVPAVTQSWTRGTAGRIEAANSNVTGAPDFVYLIDGQPDSYSFDLGRRLKCATAGGEWTYQYTNGQLTSAVHTGTLPATSLGSFSYSFDGIGRRTDKGTDNTTDLLNRTTAWINDQTKTLWISAAPTAHVWVNETQIQDFTGTADFAITPPGDLGGWVPWCIQAVLTDAGEGAGVSPINPHASPDAKAEQTGAVWVPPVNETFGFDDAGNRQSSALWDYGWDGRDKLVRARTKNHDASVRGYDITFGYDAEGRRFRKNVKVYQNGVLVSQDRITFIWDGWDLIYELHQNPSGLTTLERKYVWGPDIAGGTGGDTGAGGAGGLLVIRETRGTQTKDYYPLYDGSGHVTGLTTIIDSVATLVAEYAYGPFGELIHARGPMALANPWRYATKYYDSETGLYYYGARYLDPVTGQWLSREPLGESESVNLYAYCGNDPVNNVDALGMQKVPVWQASRDLLALALQCRLITEEAADNDIIDTALLNSKLTAAGQFPIVLFGGQVYRPTIVCHGKSGGGAIEGVTRLFSIVNGQVHSSSSNADVTRKLGSGMWGNARALGKDIGNLGHLLWNDISYAAGETSGFDWGDSLMFYQSPFDAEGSRIAGQQQVYPGISSGNLLVKSGGFMTDALVTSGGGEIVAMSFRLTSRATGWSVRVAKGIGSSELGNALSGLGRNPLVRNLNTLDEFGSGAGFSGVYDVASGKFLAYPSGATRLANGGTPLNLVEQFGGHSDVNRALSGLLGSSSNKRLGFSMTLDDAGNIGVGWNSRTINLPNPSFPGHTVPEGMRQQVLDAIMQSTGRSAR